MRINYLPTLSTNRQFFFESLNSTDETQFEDSFQTYFEISTMKSSYDAMLWKNDQVIYQTDETLVVMQSEDYPAHKDGENGIYKFAIGVKLDWIESRLKDQIYQQIHNTVYQYEAYMWVNEVINYEGGDNYAIRRIHPNAEEGVYLSTSMTDIEGNFPYLEELEGVKAEGEIFFTYYFKKLSTNEISEKLTYAKLYEPFDWIIAMGIYVDDTDAYITGINQLSQNLALYFILLFIIILSLIIISAYVASHYIRNREYEEEKRILQNRINFDSLTGVLSRNAADEIIDIRFQQFKKDGLSPILMLFDIDGFKQINDTYGHACGDKYLKLVAQNVKSWIREQDLVFRYGGDEFIILYEGLKIENAEKVAIDLLNNIHLIEDFCKNESINVSISIGISSFYKNDVDIQGVLTRADQALYQAKKNGKDQVKLFTE